MEQDVDSHDSQRRHWEAHMLGSVTAPLNMGVEAAATVAKPQLKCTFRPWKGASDSGKLTLGLRLDFFVFVLKLCIWCL